MWIRRGGGGGRETYSDLTIYIGAEGDRSDFVQLQLHVWMDVHGLVVAPAASALSDEALSGIRRYEEVEEAANGSRNVPSRRSGRRTVRVCPRAQASPSAPTG
jgi:hypothetical protein